MYTRSKITQRAILHSKIPERFIIQLLYFVSLFSCVSVSKPLSKKKKKSKTIWLSFDRYTVKFNLLVSGRSFRNPKTSNSRYLLST